MATRTKYIDMAGLTPIVDGIRVGATKPGQLGSELTGTEIALLDGLTAGTVTASKAVVVDANKDIGSFRNVTATTNITSLGTINAGISGDAGVVDIFPATAARGKIQLVAANSAGDTTTTITNASQAGAVTYTIPDAGASASFVMTEGAQTVNGAKTFSGVVGALRPTVADAAFASPVALTTAQSGSLCVFDETAGSIFTLPAAAAGLYYDFVIAVASSSNHHRVACTSGDFLLGSIMSHATDADGFSSAYAANGTTHLAIQLDSDAVGRLAGGKFRVTAISGTQWVIEGDLLATGTVATPFETV